MARSINVKDVMVKKKTRNILDRSEQKHKNEGVIDKTSEQKNKVKEELNSPNSPTESYPGKSGSHQTCSRKADDNSGKDQLQKRQKRALSNSPHPLATKKLDTNTERKNTQQLVNSKDDGLLPQTPGVLSSSRSSFFSRGRPPIVEAYCDVTECFGAIGDRAFLIFKIQAELLSKVIRLSIDPQETLVVKEFSPDYFFQRCWWRYHDVDPHDLPRLLDNCYKTERKATARLFEDGEINNCYVDHRQFIFEFLMMFGLSMLGKCIVSRFIESRQMPNNEETYQQARHQLSLIHNLGIAHMDIRSDNILYDNEGKLYFIDFGNAIFDPCYYELAYDEHCLDMLFPIGRTE